MSSPLRRNLYKRDPHCHWCGRETYLVAKPEGFERGQQATVDHVKCRAETPVVAGLHGAGKQSAGLLSLQPAAQRRISPEESGCSGNLESTTQPARVADSMRTRLRTYALLK